MSVRLSPTGCHSLQSRHRRQVSRLRDQEQRVRKRLFARRPVAGTRVRQVNLQAATKVSSAFFSAAQAVGAPTIPPAAS